MLKKRGKNLNSLIRGRENFIYITLAVALFISFIYFFGNISYTGLSVDEQEVSEDVETSETDGGEINEQPSEESTVEEDVSQDTTEQPPGDNLIEEQPEEIPVEPIVNESEDLTPSDFEKINISEINITIPDLNETEENLTEPINITELVNNTEVNVSGINITEINISGGVNFSEGNLTEQINVTELLNITELNVTELNVTETNLTNQSNMTEFYDKVIANQPVKWTRMISLEEEVNQYEFYLPEDTIKFEILDIHNNTEDNASLELDNILIEEEGVERPVETTNLITGNSVVNFETFYYDFLDFFSDLFKLTGFAVYEEEQDDSIKVIIDEPVQKITVEYYLPGPTTNETNLSNGKIIELNNPEKYNDVYVLTEVNELDLNSVIVYSDIEDIKQQVGFETFDLNNNGLIDFIGWNASNETTQTFQIIIKIIGAQHLDVNRSFISDIYNETIQLDGNWSETINNSEYVRVTFEVNLTNVNDITIFPRTINGTPTIEVYEVEGNEVIAKFENIIDNQYNKVYLTNLSGTQDTFDLKILNGDVQFDHIIDPGAGFAGNTRGLVVYGLLDVTDYYPVMRIWNGSNFESQVATSPGLEDVLDVPEWVTVLSSTQRNQTAVSIIDSAGDIAVNVYNMSNGNWINTTGWWLLANVGTSYDNYPLIDISVEDDTGDFLFVYELTTANNRIMAYNTFDGSSLSTQGTFTFNSDAASEPQRVVKTSRAYPGTSEILVAFAGTADDISFARWDGTGFYNITTITTAAAAVDEERFDISWESTTQDAILSWGDATGVNYSYWSNATKEFSVPNGRVVSRGAVAQQVDTCSDPSSDYIGMFVGPDSLSDAVPQIWDGSSWITSPIPSEDTGTENTASRNAVCSWTTNSSIALFAYSATSNAPTLGWFIYNKSNNIWTCPANGQNLTNLNSAQGSGGPCQTTSAMADDIETITIHRDPLSNEIMFIGEGLTRDLEAWIFNGTNGLVQPTTNVLTSTGASCTTLGSCLGFDFNNYYPEEEIGGDTTPPVVTINFPEENATYLLLYDLPFDFSVTLDENGTVDYSLDGGVTNYTMETSDNLNFNYTLESLDVGDYTFNVYANDTSGNKNFDTSVNFTLAQENILINGTVVDSSGDPLNTTFIIYDENLGEYVYNETNISHETIIPINTTYTLEILPLDIFSIDNIEFTEVNFSEVDNSIASLVNIDQLNGTDNFTSIFAVDQQLNTTNSTVHFTASSEVLYKCAGWNFTSGLCDGEWVLFMDNLSLGEEYNFTISPGDPGYGIIEITSAKHLNENYTFVSNVYDQVKALDGNWSETIPDTHYVRISFIEPLDSSNDITVYPRTISGSPKIEIYEREGSQLITEFSSITDNQYNSVYLTNLSGTQDTFDLKILNGDVQFDHIIDPAYKTPGFSVYRNLTSVAPFYASWNSTAFNTVQNAPELDAASTIQYVLVKSSPTRNQSIVGISDVEGHLALNVYSHNTSTWYNTTAWDTFGAVGTTVDNFKYWDIGTEYLTGDFLVVYESGSGADRTVGYTKWNGTGFTTAGTFSFNTDAAAEAQRNIVLIGKNGTNEIAVLTAGATDDLSFARWDGTGFYNITTLSLSAAPVDEERYGFAWESASGDGIVVWGSSNNGAANYSVWNDSTKSFMGPFSMFVNRTAATSVDSVHLCSDPVSDYVGVILGPDSTADVLAMMWNGTAWEGTYPLEETAAENVALTNARCRFTQNTSVALFAYGENGIPSLSTFIYNKSNTNNMKWMCPFNSANVTNLNSAMGSGGPCINTSMMLDDIEALDLVQDPLSNDIWISLTAGLQVDYSAFFYSLTNGVIITRISTGTTQTGVATFPAYSFDFLRYFGTPDAVDSNKPVVTALVPSANSEYFTSQIINISANVTDDIAVSKVFANITKPDSSIEIVNLTNTVGDKYNSTYLLSALTGTYNLTYFANDTTNNINYTEKTNFTVATGCTYGTSPPTSGNWVIADNTLCENMEITLSTDSDLNVTGNLTLTNVNLTLTPSADGGANISVYSGGKLTLNVSDEVQLNRITSSSTSNEISFVAYSGSFLRIDHTNISEVGWTTAQHTGGIYVETLNFTLTNSRFINNFRAFIIEVANSNPSDVYVANVTITSSGSNPFYLWDNLNGAYFENVDAGNTHTRGYAVGGVNNTFVNLTITNTTSNVGLTGASIWRRTPGTSDSQIRNSTFINSTIANGFDSAYTVSNNDRVDDLIINSNLTTYATDGNTVITFASGSLRERRLTLVNTSFDTSSITSDSLSTVDVRWYLDVNVKDSNGNLQSASVNTTNISGVSVDYQTTDSNGNINRLNLTEFSQVSSTKSYQTNYTINASKIGYNSNYVSLNLTRSYNVSILLSESASQVSCVYGANPPISGDWLIDNTTLCENVTILMPSDANLNVTGNLTLTNVTLIMNPSGDGRANITIYNGSRLTLNVSNDNQLNKINSSNSANEFGFFAANLSDITIRNTNISEVGWTGTGQSGGIYLQTNNVTVTNTVVSNNNIGFVINTTGESIINFTNISIYASTLNPLYLWDNVDNAVFQNIHGGSDNTGGYVLGGFNNTFFNLTIFDTGASSAGISRRGPTGGTTLTRQNYYIDSNISSSLSSAYVINTPDKFRDVFIDSSLHSTNGNAMSITALTDSNLTLINVSIDRSDLFFSDSSIVQLDMRWYVEVNTSNATGNLADATVTIKDVNNALKATESTGSDGKINRANITEVLMQVDQGVGGQLLIYYTNHTINATKTGHKSNQVSVNLTNLTNTRVGLYLNSPPSQVTLNKPEHDNYTTNRTPTFTWFAATDPDSDTVNYQLQVDDDINFGAPEVDTTTSSLTYTLSSDLSLDTTYYWRVRAYDNIASPTDDDYGAYSSTRNFTVQSSVVASLTNNVVDFGNVVSGVEYNTSDDDPVPFGIRNDGNGLTNVSVYSTQLFGSRALPDSSYRFKSDNRTEPNSFTISSSITNFFNMPSISGAVVAIAMLKYQDVNDEAELDISLEIPTDEEGGIKTSTVTFQESLAE